MQTSNQAFSAENRNKPQLKNVETVWNILKPWSICSGGSQGLGFRGLLSKAKPFQSHSKPLETLGFSGPLSEAKTCFRMLT